MSRRLVLVALVLASAAPLQAQFPPDSTIQRLLDERVERGRNPGIVLGVVDESGARVFTAGTSGREHVPLTGRTLFEIGSITKVFTAVLLQEMMRWSEVRLQQPLAELLPANVPVPANGEEPIRLVHLATHSSGLPRLPGNLVPADPADPYADYTAERLYAFLSSHALARTPGESWEYSNLGAGLLGHALALRAGASYEELLTRRVLDPLGLLDTRITLDAERQARLARGFEETGAPAAYWTFDALAGAGALRSTADDMLQFLASNLGLRTSPLGGSLAAAQAERATAAVGPHTMALGWLIDRTFADRELFWHNGGTAGFRSFLAFDPVGRRGAVVLTNSAVPADDIGLHLLDPRRPLWQLAGR